MPAISASLVEKFLKGECTEDEAAIVEAYFEQHPDDVFLLDEYEAAEVGPDLPEGYGEEMREVVVTATRTKQNKRYLTLRPMLAAAALLLLVSCWWLLRPAAGQKKAGLLPPKLAMLWVGKHNSDTKKLTVQLPDSSEAILSPGTTIRYRKDFGHADQREVKVEGNVVFTVIKEKEIPFVVSAENVKATVLGTIFEVTAEKNSDRISVRLMEGNLIVHISHPNKVNLKKYFLSPGEEFVYGKWNDSVVVRKFAVRGGGYAAPLVKRLPMGHDNPNNWYMFNNQSLAEVFDQLALLYNVDIKYNPADLRNKSFIGKLEKRDSLSKVMRDIARLNHLQVTIEKGQYIVRQQQP